MPLLFEAREENGLCLGTAGEAYDEVRYMLPSVDEHEYPLLTGIDRYGTTIFNGLQCERLGNELARLRGRGLTKEQSVLLDAIQFLADQVRERPHRLLWVIGD
jgi:hypothetical protein